jgi:hypothetical protein
MRNVIILILAVLFMSSFRNANHPVVKRSGADPDSILPVRGFCIGAPGADHVDEFVKFISEELAPRKVNTLVLRIDYNYQFERHPELSAKNGLTKADVKKMLKVCRDNHINLIPMVNMLGHQSWASNCGTLLRVYPQFDETPWVAFPEKYKWPNADNLYCKSYCPLHPDVHKVVFDVMDELCDAFESNAFHAGMDEVFYIGESKCPRCGGRDKAELFGGEVTLIRNHLAEKGRKLWIWGDRLLDGKSTGMGEWEASYNNTYRAIDLIPKDVVICDWHYDRPDKTPVYFAMKGLQIITCPWRKPQMGTQQLNDMLEFRKDATPEMRDRYYGMMQTVWSGAEDFLDEYYGRKKADAEPTSKKHGNPEETTTNCFKTLFAGIDKAVAEK